MPEFELPSGQYITVCGIISASTGGKTRALLMRNRLFAETAGVKPIIATLEPRTHYPEIRRALAARGELPDSVRLVNLFEHYRELDLLDRPAVADALPTVEGFVKEDVPHPDGTVFFTRWVHPRTGRDIILDYKRADGSTFLRTHGAHASKILSPTDVYLVDSAGRPVGQWPTLVGLRQAWLRELTPPGERLFVISDSQSAVTHVLPMPGDDAFVVYVVHNIHSSGDWNSRINHVYVNILNQLQNLDGLVTLTRRQSDEIGERFGHRTNLYCVPNPTEPAEPPVPLPPRERAHFAMVCRLDPQKGVDDAIRMFDKVLKDEPEATLDIYGDGAQHFQLQSLIDEMGLGASVRLKGHDPTARDALWTATGFVMTSTNEGFPLATLESFSHGCPVIGYDVRYGVREQISDGVDGYVVPALDAQTMADRLVSMIRDPDLVARLSAGAFEKARSYDYRAFMRDWKFVLDDVVDAKPRRVVLKSVKLAVNRLAPVEGPTRGLVAAERTYRRLAALPLRGRPAAVLRRQADRTTARRRAHGSGAHSATFDSAPVLRFEGRLSVQGSSTAGTLDDAVVSLDAIAADSPVVAPIGLTVRRKGRTFDLSADIDTASVFAEFAENVSAVRLRLRLVWHNASWQVYVRRDAAAASYELSFAPTGEAIVWRPPGGA